MFSFFKKKSPSPAALAPVATPVAAPDAAPVLNPPAVPHSPLGAAPAPAPAFAGGSLIGSALVTPIDIPVPGATPPERQKWVDKLKASLGKTASSISTVFGGSIIDEALYESLEEALLMADTGVPATQYLLGEVRRKVNASGVTHPVAMKNILVAVLTDLLAPLEKALVIGQHQPTVIMVAGVNGAGKTTSIGKLTKHLSNEGASVLLAAADTFRAAAREQLGVWEDRNLEELKKIKRVIQKAEGTAPHEVLLVIDGNTGQNALTQVRAFDAALGLTGLIVTKLDGTAKGGVLAAIAREKPIPVYFIGVGEKLEELETFNAREFAQALLG